MGEFYYNLETGEVEEGKASDVFDRMGPYATREEAANALKSAGARNEKWDKEDKEWEDWDDDGEPDED